MIALILNSGMGSRMGKYTSEHPKCMTDLTNGETIISRQLRLLVAVGIQKVVITTGYFNEVLMTYCYSLNYPLEYEFVYNPLYRETNYIYSIYCAREYLIGEDILMLHGDLVFDETVLNDILADKRSCMKVSSTLPLPDKDFKAVIDDGKIMKIGVEFFDNAMEAQAMYKLNKADWNIWLERICKYCEFDRRKYYAEDAFNEISDECIIYAHDMRDVLCTEIDTPDDWKVVLEKLKCKAGK